MHVPRIVCVCFSTVNVGKCKQQVTELLLHMITINFENGYGLTSDSLVNRHFEYCLHEILFFDCIII
jgi:hypothetical protein